MADTLTLHGSEDAWPGDAQFSLTIDGNAIGVTLTNDADGGSATTDRNFHVDGINVNGKHDGSGVTAQMSNGTVSWIISTLQ